MSLSSLGWSAFFEPHLPIPASHIARVIAQGSDLFLIHDGTRELLSTVRGRLRQHPQFPPAVGDWVVFTPTGDQQAVIDNILPRRTSLARKESGRSSSPQVLASNIDRVLLVTSMNQDFSARRLERYLALVWESGATPILVLTKSDLTRDPSPFLRQAEVCALGFPVVAVSNFSRHGIDELQAHLPPQETIVLLGSSGVGKSTLINTLAGTNLRETRTIRETDGKGRHTTTERHLLALPSGLLVIDTPGLREVQLWTSPESLARTFPEIAALSGNCRFRDCRHQGEPGCAVTDAVHSGEIDATRLASLHRLEREVDFLERQSNPLAAQEHKRRVRKLTRAYQKKKREGM